jgi:WD40 repeat protein
MPTYAELAVRARRELAAHPAEPLQRIDSTSAVYAVSWHPDGRIVIVGDNPYARLYDVSSNTPKEQLAVKAGNWRSVVGSVAFSPDGTRLAAVSTYRSARIWDRATGEKLLEVRHDNWVTQVAFSPDGTKLATGSEDKSARIWDTATGQKLLEVHHDAGVWPVAFSPDGTKLATGSLDKSARIWDTATGIELLEVHHDSLVRAVAFSPDGTKLATGSDDKSAQIWSIPEL